MHSMTVQKLDSVVVMKKMNLSLFYITLVLIYFYVTTIICPDILFFNRKYYSLIIKNKPIYFLNLLKHS
jgi:hypothetical protein